MSMLKKIQNLLFEEDDDDIIDDEDELEDTAETKLASKPAAAAKPVPAFDTTPAVQETKPTGMQRIDVTQSVPIEQTRPQKKKNESVFKQPEPAAEETKPASSIGSIKLDEEKNKVRGTVDISAADSRVKILVIPTNEELMIARDTYEIITK